MIAKEALELLKIDLEVSLVELYSDARILRQKVDAIRTGENHDRELISKILENSTLGVFPQDNGKVIFTNGSETPTRIYTLPRHIWFQTGSNFAIGWRANNRMDVQNNDFKKFLKERNDQQIVELEAAS